VTISVLPIVLVPYQSGIETVQGDGHTIPPCSFYASPPASKFGSNGYHHYTTVYGQDKQDGNVVAEEVHHRHFRLDPKIKATGEHRHPLADQRPTSVVQIWFAENGVEWKGAKMGAVVWITSSSQHHEKRQE
jgi:hypothetical protein